MSDSRSQHAGRLLRRTVVTCTALLLFAAPHAARAAAASGPVLVSLPAASWPQAELAHPRDAHVLVEAQVAADGTVREARVRQAASPFDSPAVEAVRWALFAPARDEAGVPHEAHVTLTVEFHAADAADAEPLDPDVLTMARQAERRGNLREALDFWTGALNRSGRHLSVRNPWPIRGEILRVAGRLPKLPDIPNTAVIPGSGIHADMQRDMGRQANARFAAGFDRALAIAPWWGSAYRWNAAACAASGRREDAARMAMCWRIAAHDSASHALAQQALTALAAGDSLKVYTLLK